MIILLLCVALFAYIGNMYMTAKKLPPGPIPLPLIGNFAQIFFHFSRGKGIVAILQQWKESYGPVFTMWFGPFPIVNICDWKTAQDAMLKKANLFARRTVPYVFTMASDGMGVIFSSGPHWVEQRRFALHSLKNFGLGKNVMEDRIMMEIDIRFAKLEESIRENGGELNIDPEQFLDLTVGSIINRILFTERFTEESAKRLFQLKDAMNNVINNINLFDLIITKDVETLPFVRNRVHLMMQPQMELIKFCKEQMDKRKKEIASGEHELLGDGDDFVDAFLIEMERRKNEGESVASFNDESLAKTLADLWAAGLETTSTTMYWALTYLLLHPNVLDQVREELIAVTEGRDSLSMSDKANTPLFNAFIMETLRMSLLLPMNLWRSTEEATQVGEYVIPRDTAITAQISLIMTDPDVFDRPHEFDPSRYLGEERLDQHVVAFGLGKRACLGEAMARAELYLIIGNLLLHFDIGTVKGALPRMTSKSELGTLRKANPYEVNFKVRSK